MVEFEGKEAIADKETNEVTSYNKGPNFRKKCRNFPLYGCVADGWYWIILGVMVSVVQELQGVPEWLMARVRNLEYFLSDPAVPD